MIDRLTRAMMMNITKPKPVTAFIVPDPCQVPHCNHSWPWISLLDCPLPAKKIARERILRWWKD